MNLSFNAKGEEEKPLDLKVSSQPQLRGKSSQATAWKGRYNKVLTPQHAPKFHKMHSMLGAHKF